MEAIESVYSNPETLLLECVRKNDVTKIRELVENIPRLITHEYGLCFSQKTIIEIACSTFSAEIEPMTIDTLLDLGADLSSKYIKKAAIHYSAISCNRWLLEKICDRLKQEGIDDNYTECRDTALLCIIKYCDCEALNAFDCIKILLEHKADVNKTDCDGISPILHAANKGYRKVISLLLGHQNIDIDSHSINNQTARDIIIRDNLYNKKKLPPKKTVFSSLMIKKSRNFKERRNEDFLASENDGCRRIPCFHFELERIGISSPQEHLLEHVRNNHKAKIQKLVKSNIGLLEQEYGKPFNGKTIAQIMCSTLSQEVTSETVLTLIELGVDLSKPSKEHGGKHAIHFAATSLNEWLLEKICQNITREEIDSTTYDGETALLSIIRYCDCESKKSLECIKVLIDHNADVNKADVWNRRPILLAAVKAYPKVVALLLECEGVDINTHTIGNKTAADWIFEYKLCDMEKLPSGAIIPSKERLLLGEMFKTLRERREEDFLELEITRDVVETIDDSGESMLQICAEQNLSRCARRLLELGANVNECSDKCPKTPLLIAAENGHYEVFEEMCVNLEEIPQDMFKCKLASHTVKMNLKTCLEIILKKYKCLANRKSFGRTPLSEGIRWADKEVILLLLNNGASLSDSDHGDNIDDEELLVTFNYKTLLPGEFLTRNVDTTFEEGPEHGLLDRDIRQLDSEMKVISHMSQKKRLQPLLTHPVITSFIQLKWHRIRYFFYANLCLYLIAWLSLTLYTLVVYNFSDSAEQTKGFEVLKYLLIGIIWGIFLFFIAKELFQLFVSPMLYIKQIENFLEIIFIISMGIILFLPNPSQNTKKQISATAILVSSFQLVLLIGQLPKMSTNIIMLRTVSWSFFKLLLGNAIFILAFALSFYTLFADTTRDGNGIFDKPIYTHEENNDFNEIGASLIKTFVMMTGELDASNIDFESVPMSWFVFVFFIFMIVIVLFNLMNGLAVSDTQEIRKNAELLGCKSRVDHICYIENMLLGRVILPKKLSQVSCLFPNYLNCFEMGVYFNREGKINLPHSYQDVRLDEDTLKNLRFLLKQQNRLEETDDSIVKRLETVDDSMVQIKTVVDSLQKRLEAIEDQQTLMLENMNKIIECLNRS